VLHKSAQHVLKLPTLLATQQHTHKI